MPSANDSPSRDHEDARRPDAAKRDELDAMRARVAMLEAENRKLAAERPAAAGDDDAPASPRRRQRWRAPVSAICIILAAILVPLSVVASWTRAELVDPEAFVQTFAPLADDPHVQGVIVDKSLVAIDGAIDIDGLTNQAFDGIAELGLPPRAGAAIDLLRVPAAAGIRSILDNAVTTVVASDAFSSVWERTLRLTHGALLSTVSGDTSGVVVVSDRGEVGIQLGPIISELRERLIAQGFGIASMVPPIEQTIVIAQSDALVTVNVVYSLAVAVGSWLPVLCLVLFALGIALARRRNVALVGSGIAVALGGGVLVLAFGIAGNVLALSAAELGIPSLALTAVFTQLVGAMHATASVLVLLGVLLAVFAWVAGPSRSARRIQGLLGSLNASARASLASHGLNTGAAGSWLWRQRVLVRVILVVLGVLWLWALQPLTGGDVFMVLAVGLVVWWLTELAQRRPAEVEAEADAEEDEPVVVIV